MDKQQEIISILKAALNEIAEMKSPYLKLRDYDDNWFEDYCYSCDERIEIAKEALEKVRDLE
jgi:hypothetical protein